MHPAIQTATLHLENPGHPDAGLFAAETSLTEEWYNFQANPRPAVDVIMTIDEASYNPGPAAIRHDDGIS